MNVNLNPAQLTIPRLCAWAMGYALRRWIPFLAVIGALLLRVGLDVFKPWPMVFLIDYVLKGNLRPAAVDRLVAVLPGAHTPLNLAAWAIAATVLVFLLSWVVGLVTTYANIHLGQRITYDVAGDLFSRLQQLSLNFHARKAVGDTIRRVTSDCACASIIVKDALLPVFSSLITLVSIFLILWHIDITLTLLSLAVIPFMLVGFIRCAAPMVDLSYQQQQTEGKVYDFVEQTLSAIPIVQTFGREDRNDIRLAEINAETLRVTMQLTRVQLEFKILMGAATALGTAAILWIGSHHALAGQLSIGGIIAFLSYLGALYAPLEAVMYTSSTLQGAMGCARRVLEILQTPILVRDHPAAVSLAKARGELVFQDVTFGYDEGRPVLKNVSMSIAAGQTLALVGATGAGKSTLVSLIPRFFDPWTGAVLLDGRDLREFRLRSLRHNVAMVLQDPFLFPISIAENIAYGTPAATSAEIEAAARAAHAHEFIVHLPEGYNTILGERGATLSGGERQRISIARALLRNAPVLILDEPTSALDAATEHGLLDALDHLTRGRTTIIIAHRFSTIRRAHRVVVLVDGRTMEAGTHDELLRRGGAYSRFYELQSGPAVLTPQDTI